MISLSEPETGEKTANEVNMKGNWSEPNFLPFAPKLSYYLKSWRDGVQWNGIFYIKNGKFMYAPQVLVDFYNYIFAKIRHKKNPKGL